MTEFLTGKIIWINDELNYNALTCNNYEHLRMKIKDVRIVETEIIKFLIPKPNDVDAYHPKNCEKYISREFKVNLNPLETSETKYNGTYTDINDIEYTDKVDCELFYNQEKYFLYGNWNEYRIIYKWWAIIYKQNKTN